MSWEKYFGLRCDPFKLDACAEDLALSPDQVAQRVVSQLEDAGAGRQIFTAAALKRIHEISHGDWRKVSILAKLCMIEAMSEGTHEISTRLVNWLDIQGSRTGNFPQFIGDAYAPDNGPTAQPTKAEPHLILINCEAEEETEPETLLLPPSRMKGPKRSARPAAATEPVPTPVLRLTQPRSDSQPLQLPLAMAEPVTAGELKLTPALRLTKPRPDRETAQPLPMAAEPVEDPELVLTPALQLTEPQPRRRLLRPSLRAARGKSERSGRSIHWVSAALAVASVALIFAGQTYRWNPFGNDGIVVPNLKAMVLSDALLGTTAASGVRSAIRSAGLAIGEPRFRVPSSISAPSDVKGPPAMPRHPARIDVAWRMGVETDVLRPPSGADEIKTTIAWAAPWGEEPYLKLASNAPSQPKTLIAGLRVPLQPALSIQDILPPANEAPVLSEGHSVYAGRAADDAVPRLDLYPGAAFAPDQGALPERLARAESLELNGRYDPDPLLTATGTLDETDRGALPEWLARAESLELNGRYELDPLPAAPGTLDETDRGALPEWLAKAETSALTDYNYADPLPAVPGKLDEVVEPTLIEPDVAERPVTQDTQDGAREALRLMLSQKLRRNAVPINQRGWDSAAGQRGSLSAEDRAREELRIRLSHKLRSDKMWPQERISDVVTD